MEKKTLGVIGLIATIVSLVINIARAAAEVSNLTVLIQTLLIGQAVTLLAVLLLVMAFNDILNSR
jgi:uncharacterized protein (DUF2141 family)